ncbi:MAG: hypothetical protein KDD60_12015 [Bdellovibrionales bacterium]|nr:hypothetical protein [Bdellovibrionales bacterium]
MTLEEFETQLVSKKSESDLQDFCRQKLLHGTPFVFLGREDDFFCFKKRICAHLDVHHTEVYIVGSGKLGFSPVKRTPFSLDSDIDVAIVSPDLWEKFFELGLRLEYGIRSFEVSLHKSQWQKYIEYLRYGAMGWVRPDLIPSVPPMRDLKQEWFDFFNSISFEKSEVGNYKVTAGIYRSQAHLEKYSAHSFRKVQRKLEVNAEK